jgi:signal transduction histidine kinase
MLWLVLALGLVCNAALVARVVLLEQRVAALSERPATTESVPPGRCADCGQEQAVAARWPLIEMGCVLAAALLVMNFGRRVRTHATLVDQLVRFRRPLSRAGLPPRPRELAGHLSSTNALIGEMNGIAAAIQRSASDSAHALRSPLSVIKIAIRRARAQAATPAAGVDAALAAAEANIERMSQVIDAVQALAEETAALIVAPRRREALDTAVRGALEDHEGLGDQDVRLVVVLTGGVSVLAPQGVVPPLLHELLANASAMSPPGGRIGIRLERDGDRAVLTVEDEGPCLSPDALETVYEQDYHGPVTPMRRRSYAIAKRSAEILGGEFLPANRPSGGFAVVVTLPLA